MFSTSTTFSRRQSFAAAHHRNNPAKYADAENALLQRPESHASEILNSHGIAINDLLDSSVERQVVHDHIFAYLDEFGNLCYAVNTLKG